MVSIFLLYYFFVHYQRSDGLLLPVFVLSSVHFKRTKVQHFCRKTKCLPPEIVIYTPILLCIPSFLRTFAAVFVESGIVRIPQRQETAAALPKQTIHNIQQHKP